ncbi:MAG: hypothetical protein JRH20_25620, partial [Deltaproteobacteria bacterium]|nr:hypothetical protein [Deltaproteobacteria bacterium]
LYGQFLLRFFTDFGSYARGGGDVAELADNEFHLLLGSLEGRNIYGFLDFSLGRQYQMEGYDLFALDGLRLRVNLPYELFVEGSFGVQVNRAHPFAPAVFETDGTSGEGGDEPLSPVFSVAVGVDAPEIFQLRVAYRGVASYGEAPASNLSVAQELWGVDQEILVAQVAMRLPIVGTRISGGLRYNLLTALYDELGLQLSQGVGRHRFELEALRSRPHFDGDSIFNVFALEPYSELAARYAWRILDGLSVATRLGYRWFFTPEEVTSTAESLAWALSLAWRPSQRFFASSDFFWLESEDAGERLGGDIMGRWTSAPFIYGRRLTLEGRVSLARYVDHQRDLDAITTFGVQLGGTLRILPGMRLHLLVEDNINRLNSSVFRFLAMLDMEFRP